MSRTVQCPKCGQSGKMPDNAVGKTVRCPKCGERFGLGGDQTAGHATHAGVSQFMRGVLLDGEHIVYAAKLHWILFVLPAVSAVVFFMLAAVQRIVTATVGAAFADRTTGETFGTALAAGGITAALGMVLFLVLCVLRYLSSEFVVTNRRVLSKDGVLRRRSLELLLVKVESVAVEQELLGRLLGYGTIVITGTGGTKEPFKGIAGPTEFCRHVRQQINPQ